jgi:hypothetical protein
VAPPACPPAPGKPKGALPELSTQEPIFYRDPPLPGRPPAPGKPLPELFLFAAVFSTTGLKGRRDAVRYAWMKDACAPDNIQCKFILTGAGSAGRQLRGRTVGASAAVARPRTSERQFRRV